MYKDKSPTKCELDYVYSILLNITNDFNRLKFNLQYTLEVDKKVVNDYLTKEAPWVYGIEFNEPEFKHNCDKCIFIARLPKFGKDNGDSKRTYDWYRCGESGEIIIRSSSDPLDYVTYRKDGWSDKNIRPIYNIVNLIKEIKK